MNDQVLTSLLDRRLVRNTLGPLAHRIGEQQNTVVQLDALQRARRSATGTRVTEMVNPLDDIEVDFERAILGLPDHLREDGRVTDVRKSLTRLRTSVEALVVGD
jgi:hypothetical protein